MSTARLSVWVSQVGNACKTDTTYTWYVHVLHCDGTLLEWQGAPVTNIPAPEAHAEVEVPPGQYIVVATWGPGNGTPEYLGNHLTHLQVVRVNCGDNACVYLFAPTLHVCLLHVLMAINAHTVARALDPKLARNAAAAVDRLMQTLPADPLAVATRDLGADAGTERPADAMPEEGKGDDTRKRPRKKQ